MLAGCIVVLTLDRHKDGIWICRLVEELNLLILETNKNTEGAPVIVEVRTLEGWMGQGWCVSKPSPLEGLSGIINRVSDAAPAALFKACVAILTAAQSLGLPVINGPHSYSICANKWCQHILFQQAGLQAPTTVAFYQNIDDDPIHLASGGEIEGGSVLVKPNSGGFGAGISKHGTIPDSLPSFEDDVTLLQRYIPPRDGKLYRVWFLDGKVQCALERTVENGTSEFSGACAGSSCSIRTSFFKAYAVPKEVRHEIENLLLPLMQDAHCGSVEYLYSDSGKRLYFDLNLLSTLPVRVSDPKSVWKDDYNPWKELANTFFTIIQRHNDRNR